jgi:hypothetical protein
MHARVFHRRHLVLATFVFFTSTQFVAASDEPNLNKEQIEQFLLNAKVVGSRHTSKGITSPWRLTLTNGTLTHDAAFQKIDDRRNKMQLSDGRIELNFVDSYKYDIAAYRLAELLGLDDMVPVTVERKWQGNPGALSWWLPVMMDEVERHKQKLTPTGCGCVEPSDVQDPRARPTGLRYRRQSHERVNRSQLEDLEN